MSTWQVTTAGGSLEFDTINGYHNSCCQIDSQHFLDVVSGDGEDGYIQVFTVNTSTWAVSTSGSRLEFDTTRLYNPTVQMIDANHALVFWQDSSSDGRCQVFTINTSTWGVSTASSPLEFDTVYGARHRAVKIDSNHFVDLWTYNSSASARGRAQSFVVNTTTWAVTTASATLDFNTVARGADNLPILMDANHILTVWRGIDTNYNHAAQVFTVNTTTWQITTANSALNLGSDTYVGDFLTGYKIDDTHAIVFMADSQGDGAAFVLAVNTSTWAVTTAGSRLEFDTQECEQNSCYQIDSTHYINFWGGTANYYNRAQVFTVNTSTWAITTANSVLDFDTSTLQYKYNSCCKIDSSHFINFWAGELGDGFAQVFAVEIPSSGYTLTAAHGTLTFTGQATTLNVGRSVTSSQASFTLTGQDATLKRGYVLTASYGLFTITGQDVTLTETNVYSLTAEHGSFTLSGQSVTLKASRVLTSGYGSFALTGQAATLTKSVSYTLTADHGTFALTGQAVTFKRDATLPATHTTYTLSGQTVSLSCGFKITADQGSFALTGQTVTFTRGYALSASNATFSLSGQAGTFKVARTLTLVHGTFALTGQDVAFKNGYSMQAGYGAFTLTGQAMTPKVERKLTASNGSFVLSGQATTLKVSRSLSAQPATFSLTLRDAGLVKIGSYTLIASHASFSLTGNATTLTRSALLSPAVANYGLTGQGSGLRVARNISAGQGAFTVTKFDANLAKMAKLVAQYATYTLSPQVASILGTRVLEANTTVFTLSGQDVVLTHLGIPVVQSKREKMVLSTRNTRTLLDTTTTQTKAFTRNSNPTLSTQNTRTKLFTKSTDIVC